MDVLFLEKMKKTCLHNAKSNQHFVYLDFQKNKHMFYFHNMAPDNLCGNSEYNAFQLSKMLCLIGHELVRWNRNFINIYFVRVSSHGALRCFRNVFYLCLSLISIKYETILKRRPLQYAYTVLFWIPCRWRWQWERNIPNCFDIS